jgi:hypothetical protein
MALRSSALRRAAEEEMDLHGRPFGLVLLAAAFLAGGVGGIAAFSVALVSWLRIPGTSPLAQFFALAWSCTFVVTAVLTWRRSRRARPAFLAATGLLLVLLSYLFPGGQLLLVPLFVVTTLFALLAYRYLGRAIEPAAGQ